MTYDRNLERREKTRRRQLRSLRQRRLERLPSEPKVLRIISQGLIALDRLEARGVTMSRGEVAAQLGLSREAVRKLELRALSKVRQALGIPEEYFSARSRP